MKQLTAKRVSQALSIGEFVYVKVNGKLGKTQVTGIEKLGVDTNYDFLPYEEHGEKWWLTKCAAKANI